MGLPMAVPKNCWTCFVMSTTRSVGGMLVSLLTVQVEQECRGEVIVGYAGIESHYVKGDKSHPVPERPVALVP